MKPGSQINPLSIDRVGMVAAAVVISLATFFFGQRMGNFGLLGDERFYTIVAKNFADVVFGQGLNDYRLQRILPSALVHYTLRLFQAPLTVENIIQAFGWYSVILAGIMACLWGGIARALELRRPSVWLGFCAIFLNYHFLKYNPFVLVSTDIFAYTITLALVFFYLRNNLVALAVLSVIGSFVWPTILYMGCALLLFRYRPADGQGTKAPFKINLWAALVIAGLLIYQFTLILKMYRVERVFHMGVFGMGATRPLMPAIYVSMALVALYEFFGYFRVLDSRRWFRASFWKTSTHWTRILTFVLVFASIKLVLHGMATSHHARPFDYLVKNLMFVATLQPGAFFVSHVLFFGPIVLFVPFVWKRLCAVVQDAGPGLLICFLLIIFFSLDSESRKQMNTYPIVLPFLIKALDALSWNRVRWAVFLGLSLIFSKIWYRIDPGPWGGSAQDFPAQSYYMTMGAWMNHQMYFIQAGAVTLGLIVVYFVFIHQHKRLQHAGIKG